MIYATATTVSDKSDSIHVFGYGSDNKIYHKFFVGNSWGPGGMNANWECIGGLPGGEDLLGPPLSISDKADTLHLFAGGQKRKVYHKFFVSGNWHPGSLLGDWECVGGIPNGVYNISAVSDKSDTLHVFGQGDDGNIYHKYFASGSWQPNGLLGEWECLGARQGGRLCTPTPFSDEPDTLQIFAGSDDGRVYHKCFSGGAWTPGGIAGDWQCVGALPRISNYVGDICVVSDQADTFRIFAHGGGQVSWKCHSQRGWLPGGISADLECLGGPSITTGINRLRAVADKQGNVHLIVHCEYSSIFQKTDPQRPCLGLNWTGNTQVHGEASKTAPALAVFNGRLWVAFVSNDANNKVLVCSSSDGLNWTGNNQVGGQASKTAPALAVFDKTLWIAFVSNDSNNKVLVCSSSDGVNWTANTQVQGQSSKFDPGLAVFGNMFWVAFVSNDTNNKVLVCSSADGVKWAGNIQVHGEASKTAAALAGFNNKLWVAFVSNDSNNKVLVCSADWVWRYSGEPPLQTDLTAPAVVSDKPNSFHMFALASDNLAYYRKFEPSGYYGIWQPIGGAACGWKDYGGPN